MASTNELPLPQEIKSVLDRLRAKTRRYILIEGIAVGLICCVLVFWATLAADYLPVLGGFNELPWIVRAAVLILLILGILFVSYRYIFRRVFVPLHNRSMALLIEKHYPEFGDSLVTTVELSERSSTDSLDIAMLAHTRQHATKLIQTVDPNQLFNSAALTRRLIAATLLLLSIGVSAVVSPAFFTLAAQRLYLLDNEKWPRQCQIEIVGIKVKRENMVEGIEELAETVTPDQSIFKVAKGSSITLLVRAEAATKQEKTKTKRALPESCYFDYRTEDGSNGQQPMKRIGAPRDGYQLFSLDAQPLKGILGGISFTVRGGDHRIGPFDIRVVEQPVVIETELDCRFPDYMVDEQSMRWTPRKIAWSGRSELPLGTQVSVVAATNKPLKKVYIYDAKSNAMSSIESENNQFQFPAGKIFENKTIQFFLVDRDGIVAEHPHTVSIEPIEDQPPIVDMTLQGIGTAITPDAIIPISGSIKDDYAIARQAVEIETPVTDPFATDFELDTDGNFTTAIDFRQWRQKSKDGFELPVGGENSISLVVKAIDRFNLGDTENVGVGDRYELDLVTPGQLLRLLERLEIGERRKLEQIYEEMTDARDYLFRSKSETGQAQAGLEPGDHQAEPGDSGDEAQIRNHEFRLLFAQRCLVQSEKSTEELRAVAKSFESIRLQLINNRVDSEDRKQRLSERIVAPLELIANQSMQQLKDQIRQLEDALNDLQVAPVDRSLSERCDLLADESVVAANQVLNQIDQVLGALIKYETQNELLEIVRQLIRKQKEIAERTRKERKKKAFEGLLD